MIVPPVGIRVWLPIGHKGCLICLRSKHDQDSEKYFNIEKKKVEHPLRHGAAVASPARIQPSVAMRAIE